MEKKTEIDDILKKKIIENKPGGGPKRVIKNVKILDPSKISFDVKKKIAEALTKLNATNASKKTVIPQEAKVAKQEPQQKLSVGENKSTTKRKSNEIKVLSVEKVDTPSLVQKLTNIPKCYVTDIIPGTKSTEIKLEIPSEEKIGTLRTKETNNNMTLSKAQIPVIHKISPTQQTLTAERAEKVSVINIPAPKAHTPVIQNNVQSQEVLSIERDHPVPTASVIRNEQVERIVTTQKREKVIVAPKAQTPLIPNSLPAQELPAPKIIDITEASKASRGTHVKKTTEFDVKSILNAKIKQKNSRISNDIKEENKGSLSDQTSKREVPSTYRLEQRNESPSNVFTKFENKINPKDLDKPFRGFTPEEIKSESKKLELIIRAVDNSQAGKNMHYADSNLLNQSKPHYKTRVSRKSYNAIQISDKGSSHVDNVAVKGGIDTSDIVSDHCYVTNAPFSSHQQRIDDSTSNENVYSKANRDSLQISELHNKNVSKTLDTLSSKDLRLSHSHPSEVAAGSSSHQTDRPNNESDKDVSPELRSISSLNLPIKKYERKQKEKLARNLFAAANVKCDLSIVKVENTPKKPEKPVVKVGDIIDISSLKILPNYNEKISCLVIPEEKNTQSKTTEFASTSKEIGDRTVLKESRNKEVELSKQDNERVEVTSRNPNIDKVKVENNTISKSSVATQPSSDTPKSTGSTKKKECLHEEAKELSEKICQVSNTTFSDDVVKVVKFLFPYIDVGTLNTELSKRNQKPIIKEESQDAVSFLLNCKAVNENVEDDDDYDFSYLDLLSDSDDVDGGMSVDHSEVQNVDSPAVIQIKKDPEQLSTEGSQKRPLLEPVCKDEKSTIQEALQSNKRTNKHFTSNTMVVVEQDQALDLSKTSIMSTPISNLSSKISGYDENPKVSSGGSPISVNLKSETNASLKMVSNNSYKDDMRMATKTKEFRVGPNINSGAGENENQSIVESKEDDGNNTILQLRATSVDLPFEDSQKLPNEEIVELSEDDCVDDDYDNQSTTQEVVNLDFSMPLISSFSTDYESKVLQQVSKNILVDILSKEDSISLEGKYQPTMQAEQFIERMTALEQSGFAIDLDSMKPTNVPNDVRVEILSMEGSQDREYLDEDTTITEQRDISADMPSMEAEQISEDISVEVIPVEDSDNYESRNLLVTQSEDLNEKNNESDLSVVPMDLEPQETPTVSEHSEVEMQSAEKNEVIFELDVNYNENEAKCVSKSTNSERIAEVRISDVIKKENEYEPKPHKSIQSVSGLRELKNTLLLSSAVEHAQNSNIKTNTVEETKICDEKLQKEDTTDKKEGATNPQGIKKPFKSRKAKVNLVQAKRRNVQTGKKQTSDQPNSLESEGTNLKLRQSDDNEDVMQKGTQTDVRISAEKKVIKTEQRSDTEEETIKRKLPAEDNVPLESYDTAMTMIQLHTNSSHDFKVEKTSRNESFEDSLTSTQYEVPLISDKIRLLIEENKNLFNEIPSPQYEQFSPIKSQTLHIVDGINETAVQQKIEENSNGGGSSKHSGIDAGNSYEKESKIVETRRTSEEKNTLQSKPENTNQVQYEELECTVVDEEVFEVSVNNESLQEESCVSPAPSDHSFGEQVSTNNDSVFEALKSAEEENKEKLQTVATCTEVKETNKLIANLDDERKIEEKTLLQNEDSPKIKVDEANVQAKTSDAHSSDIIIESDKNIISKFDKSSSKSVEAIQIDTDTDGEDSPESILECADSPLKSRSNEIVLETNGHVVHDEEECRIDDMSDGDKNVPVKSSDSAITTQVIPNKIVENIHEQTKQDKADPTESTCERDENVLVKSTDSSLENKISESKLVVEKDEQHDNKCRVENIAKSDANDTNVSLKSIDSAIKTKDNPGKTNAVVESVQDGRVDSTPKGEGNVSLLNNEDSDNKIAEKPNLKVKHKVRFDSKIDSVSETDKKVVLKSNEHFIKQEVSPNEDKIPTNVQAKQSMEPQTEGERNVSVEDGDPPVKRKRVRKKAVPNIPVQSKQNKERRTDSGKNVSDKGSDSSIKNKATATKKTPVRNVEAKNDKEKPVDSKANRSNTSSAEKVSDTSPTPTQKSQITSFFNKIEKTSPKTVMKQTIIAPTESLNNNMTEKQFESALNLKRRHSKTDTPANSSNTPKKSKLFDDCWAKDSDAKPKVEKITSSFLVKEIGMQSTPARSSKTIEKNIESVSSKDTSSESRLPPEPPKKKAKPDNVEDSDHCDIETQSSNIVYFMPNEKFDYDELHPNILLIDKVEDLDKPIVDKNVPIPNGSVKCGACKEIVVKRKIEAHYATHYFIGWIDGADEPVNLRSHREVANKIMKMSKKKTKVLCCRICSVEKKSAHGMISHLLDCAKANKIFACKLCKMTVKRSSIYAHTAYCKALRKADIEIKEKKRKAEVGNTEITEHSVTGRVKRRSVIKAEKKFKEISGNNFEADWYISQFKKKIVSAVHTEGSGKPSKVTFQTGYKCTLCNAFTSDNQEDVSNHISDVHRKEMCPPPFSNHSEDEAVIEPESSSESEVSADEDDIEITEKNKKRERKPKSKKSIEIKNTSLNVTNCENQILYSKILAKALYAERNLGFYDFSPFKAFARRFRDINYFNHYILPECKPFSRELNSDVWEQYKPNNALSIKYYYKNITKPSLQYGSSSVPEKWLQLQNFEIAKRADEELLYLGGPINFLQWVPLPDDYPKNEPQFLVVAVKQRYNIFTKVKNPKTRKTLIQIWEISYKEKSSRLYYSIAIENGPICSIAFLPSGGYAPNLNRMALIVVSTVNAEIRLFPLPLKAPQNCDNSKSSISPLLDIKPFAYLKLDVRTNHENKTHKEAECIQLCWSESKGHNFIFGGFTNGFVAIWDIDQEDNLNKFSLQGSVAFIPFAYFGAVTAIISSVQVHYDERGPRWLLVTSDSRECKIYDLCDINLPVSINNDDFLRSRCSASCWPYYWQNPSVLLTDEFIAGPPHVLQKSPSGVVYRYKNNLPTSSNLNDISFSCWYNTLLVGTDNGDIYIRKQYNTLFDTTANRWKKGRFVGCTEIIRLDGSSMPKLSQSEKEKDHLAHEIRKIFDRDYMDKYGILFTSMVDAPISPYDKLTFTSRNPPHSLRDFVRISRVSINNNYVAKRLYAVGYENGFVRIRSLDELYK